jgi:predicted alpha/beta superfamily hydrolase
VPTVWNLAALLLLALARVAPAQPERPESHPGGILLVVTDKSGLVTNDSPLYLASNHAGWNPADAGMKLSGRSDLRWQILLPGPVGEPALAFKFTRGSWDACEVAADLADISNRTLAPVDLSGLSPTEPVVIELTIERFADERAGATAPQSSDDPTRPLRVTGRAVRVQVIGGAGAAAGAMRDCIVWLPPGYDDPSNAERRYPVLYMQDGQNVFDFRPPTPGEWRADETATALIEAGEIEPIIIAAVPHSGGNRVVEYLPADGLGVRGQGDAYLDWLVREVVPRVERAVRADGEGQTRGIGGSSLGGLLALRAGQRYPGVFGRVLAESPSLGVGGGGFERQFFSESQDWLPHTWLAVGTREAGARPEDQNDNERYTRAVVAVSGALETRNAGSRLQLFVDEGAQHNEEAWAARLNDALRYLYSPAE